MSMSVDSKTNTAILSNIDLVRNLSELESKTDQLSSKIEVDEARAWLGSIQTRIARCDDKDLKQLYERAVASVEAIDLVSKIYLKDYRPPVFSIPETELVIDIRDDRTVVSSTLTIQPLEKLNQCVLDGTKRKILEININGAPFEDYEILDDKLVLRNIPAEEFSLFIRSEIHPKENDSCTGLYCSKGLYITHCEPEEFRLITYHLDRPDIQSRYKTTIIADQEEFPVLLSNGNETDKGVLQGGRHFRAFVDPFPKPTYLFAMCAGKLHCQEDSFVTKSGRIVRIQIFADKKYAGSLDYPLECLKQAMKWDEEKYGREYDLDDLKIIAVDDFNMGAMENKGCLIFNSQCLIVNPKTTVDSNAEFTKTALAHEYFHNWRGNRVTIREWFQLALKEGLTTFTEQQFSADAGSRAMVLIENARSLKSEQFKEDAGPTAHPILPKSCSTIQNNFTSTTYNKGAKVFDMLKTLLGDDGFAAGMTLYFDNHDGKSAQIEDVVVAMEDVSGRDLGYFRNWFHQAGTPEVTVSQSYDPKSKKLTLHLKQYCRPTPECREKQPFHIPFAVGFIDEKGNDILPEKTCLLELIDEEHTFEFDNIPSLPVPSLLRGFSAPVIVHYPYSLDELTHMLAHDSDPYCRNDAAQRIAKAEIYRIADCLRNNRPAKIKEAVCEAYRNVLRDSAIDDSFKAELIEAPSLEELLQDMETFDIDIASEALTIFLKHSAANLYDDLLVQYRKSRDNDPFSYSSEDIGRRKLNRVCLHLLGQAGNAELVAEAYDTARCMNDRYFALKTLCRFDLPAKSRAVEDFYNKYKNDPELNIPTVFLYWIGAQAVSTNKDVLETIEKLSKHPEFDMKNPNHLGYLYLTLAYNLTVFHDISGEGYRIIADALLTVEGFGNSFMASELAGAFEDFPKLRGKRKTLMLKELNRILQAKTLSDSPKEKLQRILHNSA